MLVLAPLVVFEGELDHGAAALVGPPDRIRSKYKAWADSGLTGLTIATQQDEALELMAEIADVRPRE